jgi:hypothetical protein
VSDSLAVVRNILMHIAAAPLAEETPAEVESLLIHAVSETLADLLRPSAGRIRPGTDTRALSDQ